MKPVVVFFAFHTALNLQYYWKALAPRTDCHWVTVSSHVARDLKKLGARSVICRDLSMKKFRPAWLCSLFNKLFGLYVRTCQQRVINRAIDALAPDIVISDTGLRLVGYEPRRSPVMKVQAFHSVCFKKYFLFPFHMEYDLLLLPGEEHKKRLEARYPQADVVKTKVVGWPRGEELAQCALSEEKRRESFTRWGLDPGKKTVLFSTTYNSFFNQELFPRSFGDRHAAFEALCQRVSALGVNMLIKPHPLAWKIIRDAKLRSIAAAYNVFFYYQPTMHIDLEVGDFLRMSDVMVSGVSGMIMDFMVLDRPVVFIEPDSPGMSWEDADLPPDLRAGIVASSMEELVNGIRRSLSAPDEFSAQRREVVRRVFYKMDGRSAERAARDILDYYREFRDRMKDKDFVLKREALHQSLRKEHGYSL